MNNATKTHNKPVFNQAFFAGNRSSLRGVADQSQLIVVTANGLMQRNGDTTYAFRQDSNFWYLTGIETADIILVMDEVGEYLIMPTRDTIMETFDGAISPAQLSAASGIEMVLGQDEGWKRLAKSLKQTKQIAGLPAPAAYLEHYNFYTNPARARLLEKMAAYNADYELFDLREHLAALRAIKQPLELQAIRHAVDVTVDSLSYVTEQRRLASYKQEYEIEADLTRMFRLAGCGQAFSPIVASGARACQLHYNDNGGPLGKDELIVFDIGAESGLYAADIARTVAFGTPTKRHEAVYAAVCEVQDYAYSLLKPGVVNVEYETLVEQFMGEKLQQLGVIQTNDRQSVRKYFPHMTSHFLGLEAHDVGDYRQAMKPGMTLVVEPGIYIPEEGIGVRIEDDVLITDTGYELLSQRLPRRLL